MAWYQVMHGTSKDSWSRFGGVREVGGRCTEPEGFPGLLCWIFVCPENVQPKKNCDLKSLLERKVGDE